MFSGEWHVVHHLQLALPTHHLIYACRYRHIAFDAGQAPSAFVENKSIYKRFATLGEYARVLDTIRCVLTTLTQL